jgi:hypothetical protein
MTDEAKPPKKRPAAGAKRPRKPAGEGARKSRKPAAGDPQPAAPDDAATAAAADPPEAPTPVTPPADAPTQVTPPAEAPTQVTARGDPPTEIAPPPEAPTQVVAGSAGGPGAGGPYAPLPRVAAPSRGDGNQAPTWLIILAVVSVALAIVVALWAFVLRGGGDEFVGSWAPISGDGGGLVIELQDGDLLVSMFAPDMQLTGTYPATRDDDTLTFRFTDTETALGQVKATLEYEEDTDHLILTLSAGGEQSTPIEFVRVDALEAAPSATPTPIATPTPTASPSASPSGSPSLTPSPTGTDTGQYDQQIVNAIVQIQVGVINWNTENGSYPPANEVTPAGGVGQMLTAWPTNPYSGQPMASGEEPGDYTYEQLDGGQGYRLVGHLAGGATFTVP